MSMFKDTAFEKLHEASTALLEEFNVATQEETLTLLCKDIIHHHKEVNVSPSIYHELNMNEWLTSFCKTMGGARCMLDLVTHPTYDTDLLQLRGSIIRSFPKLPQIQRISELESAVIWLQGLPMNLADAYPLSLLFPSWPFLKYLNYVPWFIMALYAYNGYISPMMNFMYPLASIIGPYIYMRYLKFNIPFSTYMTILYATGRTMLQPSGKLDKDAMKYTSIAIYAIIHIYNIVHGFEYARIVRKLCGDITAKWNRIHEFIQLAREIDNTVPNHVIESIIHSKCMTDTEELFALDDSMTSAYKLITSTVLRQQLAAIMQKIYVVDLLTGARRILKQRGWTTCTFGDCTQIWGMGHPLLKKQVRNPLLIDRNIIITGPNAAGKTTYMKAVCANVILAQSLAFCCGTRCTIQPVHSILSSMNINDTVGKESLFEAEVRRCSLLVQEADKVRESGQCALFFLDEPMHSTPPTEGTATAMAVAKYLGNTPGVKVFMTTHYHQVTQLAKHHGDRWMNVSMEAHRSVSGKYQFPYKLRHGPSYQCIALELLKERSLPDAIIDSAIELKNKLCTNVLDI